MFDKQWVFRGLMSIKATILLDMIEMIKRKIKHTTNGRIIIFNNNYKLVIALQNEIRKEYILVAEARAKIARIKQITVEASI